MLDRRQTEKRLFALGAVGGFVSRFQGRGFGMPFSSSSSQPVRNDAPLPWRFDWGGHDPASPSAELQLNGHNAIFGFVAGINIFVFWLMRGRC